MLGWYDVGMRGEKPDIPAAGFTWRTTPDLNRELWAEHQGTSLEAALELLTQSHQEVHNLILRHTDEELFTKKLYAWTGTTSLGAYLVSSTSSHYDWGLKKIKKLRRHLGSVILNDVLAKCEGGTSSLDADTSLTHPELHVDGDRCDTVGAWRDGELLVIGRGAALPRRCIVTNEPIAGFLTTRLYWHRPAWYAALILVPGVYVIYLFMFASSIETTCGLSRRVLDRRRVTTSVRPSLSRPDFSLPQSGVPPTRSGWRQDALSCLPVSRGGPSGPGCCA